MPGQRIDIEDLEHLRWGGSGLDAIAERLGVQEESILRAVLRRAPGTPLHRWAVRERGRLGEERLARVNGARRVTAWLAR